MSPSPANICGLHAIPKAGTSDAANHLTAVGHFKRAQNVIGGLMSEVPAANPEDVAHLVTTLLEEYESSPKHGLAYIVGGHWRLERIYPFSDGNGRVGRLVMFKECLRSDVTPFIITEGIRQLYLRGLREFEREPGYLIDTCGYVQDRFEASYLPLVREFWELMRHNELGNKGIRRQSR